MKYSSIIWDIDGTLLDSESAILAALQHTLLELTGKHYQPGELKFSWGIPGVVTGTRLQVPNMDEFMTRWEAAIRQQTDAIVPFPGIRAMLEQLRSMGFRLGIATSKNLREFRHSIPQCGLLEFFEPELIVTADDTERHKPDPEPLLEILRRSGLAREEVLYIGDTDYDRQCAAGAGVAFGLACWGAESLRHLRADYYFASPEEVAPRLEGFEPPAALSWLKWAMELQFIAQAGLTYSQDRFDLERFERIREISAEIVALKSGLSLETVAGLFCSETGFQTPKLDTRAAVFQGEKILLVQERDGRWSLPGGWVDVNESIRSNTEKEVLEESGLTVAALRLIAVQDRNRHNPPPYAYGICKVFVLCDLVDGEFRENPETLACDYFGQDELPPLAEEKTTEAQLQLCFEARRDPLWRPVFD